MTKEVKRGDAPIDAAHTQMLGKPIFELILALCSQSALGWRPGGRAMTADRVERLDIFDVLLST